MGEQISIEEPVKDVLEESLLHHLMVAFHWPDRWPGWVVWVTAVSLAAFTGWVWAALGHAQSAFIVAVGLWLFMAGDLVILMALPKRRISFGPWKAQFFTLAVPRMAATMVLSLAGLWFGEGWGLALVGLVQLSGTAAFIWGSVVEPFRLQMTELTITTDRLPAGSRPIRLLHISDLHVERLTRREEKVLQLVQQAKPDLILITGDYVNLSYNRDPETHAQVRQLLRQLSAPHGVYATLGSPPVDLRETVAPIFDELPIPLMREAWAHVDVGQGRQLVLVGMDCTHHLPTDKARLKRLMATAPNGVPQILLYHSPELMPQASAHEIDLYLCGHTHGGQVRLPLIGPILTSSQLGRQYVMGLYRNGRTHLYVSRGIGLEGLSAPRVRFMAPPEMTLIELTGTG